MTMAIRGIVAVLLAASALGFDFDGEESARPVPRRLPARRTQPGGWVGQFGNPRRIIPLVLVTAVSIGLGRKFLGGWRAKGAVGRLESDDVTLDEIGAAPAHGRAVLTELFRLQAEAKSPELRDAAGRALAALWSRDELIAEEEKAIVRRGYRVDWRARKRYPRALGIEIPVTIDYGVPFLAANGPGVKPENLAWSHKVEGSRRASLESDSPWTTGSGRASFALVPSDFTTNGPHKLVLRSKVKTVGLTESWELELPHVPFTFEFDPRLDVAAIATLEDQDRADAIASAVRLVAPGGESSAPEFLVLNDGFTLRGVPRIEVMTPLTCDLAHHVEVEFEGLDGWHPAGTLILSGQGLTRDDRVIPIPLGPLARPLPAAFDRPGPRRLTVRLRPSPDHGWADPDVRSIWPGTIVLGPIEVDVVRR